MAKLDFFTTHIETEEYWLNISIELNFLCCDHLTIIECDGVDEHTDLSCLIDYLKKIFADETECTYCVKQPLDTFIHEVTISCGEKDPGISFNCNSIKITEREE